MPKVVKAKNINLEDSKLVKWQFLFLDILPQNQSIFILAILYLFLKILVLIFSVETFIQFIFIVGGI